MKRKILIFVAFFVAVSACETNVYTDGTYKAEYDAIDSHDWKAFLEITIVDDMITDADFDYYNLDMDRKSEDTAYISRMFGIVGTSPDLFCVEIENRLMDVAIVPQFDSIDAVTGATHSSHNAVELAKAALESSMEGGGNVVITQPDPKTK